MYGNHVMNVTMCALCLLYFSLSVIIHVHIGLKRPSLYYLLSPMTDDYMYSTVLVVVLIIVYDFIPFNLF
jgi:hypothetical protein